MKVNLFHHVYTSLGGYKTVWKSPDVPPPSLETFKEFSRLTHKLARRSSRFSLLGFDPHFVGISRLSLAGSDHVGRTRALVHNVLFRREEIERIPFFDPFAMPREIFLTGKGDILMEAKRLAPSFDFQARNPLSTFPFEQIPQRMARNVLRLLLHEGTSFIRAVEGKALSVVRALLPFLPPIHRERVSIISGDFVQPFDGKSRYTLFLVSPEFDLTPFVEAGYPVLDDGGLNGHNLPKAHPYSHLLLGQIYGEKNDHQKLITLLRAINAYRPIVEYSLDGYHNLVNGFETAQGFFSRDGHLHVEGAPEKGLKGALSFFRAGHPDIVFDIFNSCLHLLGERNLFTGLANFENVVVSGIDTLTGFFAEVPQDASILDDIGDFDE